MPPASNSPLFASLWRAAVLTLAAAGLGLLTNALSKNPVPLFDLRGPGALPEEAEQISPAAYREALSAGELFLLDARSEDLLTEGLPQGGYRVTLETLVQVYPQIQPFLESAKCVVVLCDSGTCSTGDRVAAQLKEFGHPGVKVFAGGWPAYKAAGLPMEGTSYPP